MKTKHYESVLIINAALEDSQIEGIIQKVTETINLNGGEIEKVENWGRKRLAYPIQKSKSGYYVVIRFSSQPELIAKVERMFRLDETIMRYITVSLSEEALEYYANQKELKAEEEAAAAKAEAPAEKTEPAKTEE